MTAPLKLNLWFDDELSRRAFLRVAAGLGVAAAAGPALGPTAARAQRVTRLTLGYMKIGDLSPMFIGLDKGFFRGEGLELNLTSMVGGAAIGPALASGALNVGWTNTVSMAISHVKGLDFKFICNGALNKKGTNDVFGVQVLRDSPIRTAKDLEGKTIATNTLNNVITVATRTWMDKNGGDSSTLKWLEIPFPQMEPALRNRQIDAFTAVEPFVTVPSSRTSRVIGHPLGEMAPSLLIASYFSTEEWINRNVDLVKRFNAAIAKGTEYHNANKEEAREIIAKHTGQPKEIVQKVALPAFEVPIRDSDVQVFIDHSFKYRLIERRFAAAEIISKLAPRA
ncbi:MAG: ABC transporter substrate-binding protein [Deltaproteobacteria bacterium]|nr:ABC transporter substrate-binding protein [Deltaproteobacteria bacterium]